MNRPREEAYKFILKSELKTALGCTEPGAIAYATFKAREILGREPEHIFMECSGNVIKNAKGVIVPNSNGLRGIKPAAILGAIVSDCKSELEVLEYVKERDIERTKELLTTDFCECVLNETESDVYIRVVERAGKNESETIIKGYHTNVVFTRKDKEVLFESDYKQSDEKLSEYKELLSVKGIVEFAKETSLDDIKETLDAQIKNNTAIADEGIKNSYGALIGRTLLEKNGEEVSYVAKAKTAAGSDARMGGCSLPVVINSGSGNQGITVTVPVIEYAKALNVSEDKMYRALLISNLIAIHIKRYIGTLSAFCGAVSAGTASAAAITYLYGGDYDKISATIINTLANVGGIVCDGAKSSCAAKIASSVDAGIMAHEMSMKDRKFQNGEGIVMEDVEETIRNIGRVGKEGMRQTDIEILNIML